MKHKFKELTLELWKDNLGYNRVRLDNVLKVGSKIKFEEYTLWFTVQAFDSRYLICTSETKLGLFHTIVDLENGIRGDDNLVFHSGYDTVELCEKGLQEFITGDLEISQRNWVQLNIVKFQQ